MKTKKLIFTIMAAILFQGCSTYNFFGLKASEAFRSDQIIIKEIDKTKAVYLYNPKTIDSSIFATATNDGRNYTLTIYNTSNMPLGMNPLKDNFYLTTTDNEHIYLKANTSRLIDKIPAEKKLKIALTLPPHLKSIPYNEIKTLTCELGSYSYKTIIILKNTKV